MTAPAIGVTTSQDVKPILSVDMFKFWRRGGVSLNLVPQGTDADNDAALAQIIRDASAWMHGDHGICLQTLNATLDTVLDTVNINRRGFAVVSPRCRPVVAVTAVSMGSSMETLAELASLSGVIVEREKFSVPVGPVTPLASSAGPIQFGAVTAPMDQALIRYSYVNGFPHTWLTAPASAGATSLALADTTGIVAGSTWLTIYAGRNAFRFLAGAVSNAVNGLGFGPGNVVCPALPYAVPNRSAYPTFISALPGNAIEAGRLAVRSTIKSGSAGNVSAPGAKGSQGKDPLGAGDDLAAAEKMLYDGGFVVPVA